MSKYPKSTIIISVYKDIKSLDIIIESLASQTILPDEVLISEDCQSEEMATFLPQARIRYPNLTITHLFQEDSGWRKNIALNRAVLAAQNEYLIFIDGDCVVFEDFIENHVMQVNKGVVLSGKRVQLGPKITQKIYDKRLKASTLTNHYWFFLPQLLLEKTRHLEDMLHISAKSFLAPYIKRHVRFIIGCNWSCYKEDLLKINGFDETYTLPSVGEDIDLGWRFRGMGIKLLSCRHNANMVHLYHKKQFDSNTLKINNEILQKNFDKNRFFCDNGITKNYES